MRMVWKIRPHSVGFIDLFQCGPWAFHRSLSGRYYLVRFNGVVCTDSKGDYWRYKTKNDLLKDIFKRTKDLVKMGRWPIESIKKNEDLFGPKIVVRFSNGQ